MRPLTTILSIAIYIGIPKMYNDRGVATKEFVTPAIAQMPDAEKRAKRYESWKRFSPLSEIHLRWSRDGLNFDLAPSAVGSLRVEIQDAAGTPIPGFTLDDSIELYGDTVARNAMWKDAPDLNALAGQPVRLRFVMRDADLYSIQFE